MPGENELKGSIWIAVNATSMAACPHCQKLSWNSGNGFTKGCEHVVGPGKLTKGPAVIFKGEK